MVETAVRIGNLRPRLRLRPRLIFVWMLFALLLISVVIYDYVNGNPAVRLDHHGHADAGRGGNPVCREPPIRQRVAGQWYVAGLRVAIDSTSRRSEGGKAPGPTRARRILQATEAVCKIATAPTANGMAVTVELLGHLKIRWTVRRRGPQNHLTPKGQGLWRGMGTHDRL